YTIFSFALYQDDLISISSITFIEPLLRISVENSIFITKLNCSSLIDASNEFFSLKKMIKKYKSRLTLKCDQDKHIWKLLLEDEGAESEVYNKNEIGNFTEHESIITMYSILLKSFPFLNRDQLEPVLELPKSVKNR